MATGKVHTSQLGVLDQQLLKTAPPPTSIDTTGQRHGLGHIGGLLSNLGEDIFSFGKHLPGGLYESGKAIAQDMAKSGNIFGGITQPLFHPSDSSVKKTIVDPTVGSYKQTYSGDVLKHLYKHPLQPILDALTVASLGAGAAARGGAAIAGGAETGAAAKLARISSREGRAPVDLGQGITIPRLYSGQPVAKLSQIGLDRLGQLPGFGRIARAQEKSALRHDLRRTATQEAVSEAQAMGPVIGPLGQALKIPQADLTALQYAWRGVNSPETIAAHENLVRQSLLGQSPIEGGNFEDFRQLGLEPGYVERAARIPDEVKARILNPTPAMLEADRVWRRDVEQGQQQLDVPPEVHEAALAQRREVLKQGGRQPEGPEPPVDPGLAQFAGDLRAQIEEGSTQTREEFGAFNTVKRAMDQAEYELAKAINTPEQAAAEERFLQAEARYAEHDPSYQVSGPLSPHDLESIWYVHKPRIEAERPVPSGYPIQPTYVPDVLAAGFDYKPPGRLGTLLGRDEQLVRGRREESTNPRVITQQNLLAPPGQRYLHESTGATFASGAFRVDARALIDHAAQRTKDIINKGFTAERVDKYAARDAEGNKLQFKNQAQVNTTLGKDWVLAHETLPIQWFHAQDNFLEKVLNIVDEMKKQGMNEFDPGVEEYLRKLNDTDAEAFVKSNFNALKRPGIAVPREFYDYQRNLELVHEPFDNAFMQLYAKWMHRWRTATLAYMPRWALNTAAGSFMLSAIKGLINPLDYIEGNRLSRQYRDTEGNIVERPSFLQRRMGAPEPDIQGLERVMPPGVELRSLAPRDFQEPGAIGHDDPTQMRFKTREIFNTVQGIEDFFRRASFVQSLRHQGKMAARSMEGSLKEFYQSLDHAPTTEDWLRNPELVKRAVDEVDEFSYAYGELGPTERRVIRQFVPFWGWYKFISKFAWSMPLKYPGRANIINNFSKIGADAEQELGLLPPWIVGAIMKNHAEKGTLDYFSTLGVNPLAQFANPLRGVGGISQIGQASPLIQAGLTAFGYDPLRGGGVAISPQEGVGRGIFGDPVNLKTGQTVQPGIGAITYKRAIAGLLRSLPEYRIAEQKLYGPVFPESLPFAPREAPKSAVAQGGGNILTQFAGPFLGLEQRHYNLGGYQKFSKANLKQAQATAKASLKKIRKSRKK